MRDMIKAYELTYYQTVREYMAQYSALGDVFPYFMNGAKRVVAMICNDGGFVGHWESDIDSFQFEHADRPITESAKERDLHLVLQPGTKRLSTSMLLEIVTPSGEHKLMHPSCNKIEAWTVFDPSEWSEAEGRANATHDILVFVAASHLRVNQERLGSENTVKDVCAKLRVAINRFSALLSSVPKEEVIQQFLDESPILLAQSAVKVMPKVKLGSEHITDFVIEFPEQDYQLVEIEQPKHALFTKSGDPTKELSHAQRQVEDWRDWVHEHLEYAKTQMPGIVDPRCLVVIGRRSKNKRDQNALRRKNKELAHIEILTYDDLLERARQFLQNLEGLA